MHLLEGYNLERGLVKWPLDPGSVARRDLKTRTGADASVSFQRTALIFRIACWMMVRGSVGDDPTDVASVVQHQPLHLRVVPPTPCDLAASAISTSSPPRLSRSSATTRSPRPDAVSVTGRAPPSPAPAGRRGNRRAGIESCPGAAPDVGRTRRRRGNRGRKGEAEGSRAIP
jgi:hypothetical protein